MFSCTDPYVDAVDSQWMSLAFAKTETLTKSNQDDWLVDDDDQWSMMIYDIYYL